MLQNRLLPPPTALYYKNSKEKEKKKDQEDKTKMKCQEKIWSFKLEFHEGINFKYHQLDASESSFSLNGWDHESQCENNAQMKWSN